MPVICSSASIIQSADLVTKQTDIQNHKCRLIKVRFKPINIDPSISITNINYFLFRNSGCVNGFTRNDIRIIFSFQRKTSTASCRLPILHAILNSGNLRQIFLALEIRRRWWSQSSRLIMVFGFILFEWYIITILQNWRFKS